MLITTLIFLRRRRVNTTNGFVVPTINFTAGVSSSHDLTQYVSGWNASTMELALQGSALPTHVTFNGTSLVFDGDNMAVEVSGIELIVIYIGA